MDTSNLSLLLDITASQDFRRFPLQQAVACESQDWGEQHEAMLKAGMELAIWEVAAFCALVLATYPETIGSIRPQWSSSQDDGKTYANMDVEIDGAFINNPDRIELDEAVMAVVAQVDGGAALGAVLEVCDNAVGAALAGHIDTINAAFSQPLTSAPQALEVMAEYAPHVSAWVEQARLERQTPPAPGRKPKGGRL